MSNKSFFIVSCARSGSTSLTKILNLATNCECAMEPTPNLNVETRLAMEGKLTNYEPIVKETIVKRVKASKAEIYGEKNVTYGPFIKTIHELLNAKFVFLIRDGRDVVRSLIDWHEKAFGTVYRECKEIGNLNEKALQNASNLPIHKDTSDYSRPRPLLGTQLYEKWENLTREEMCAFYWSYINELYISQLKQIPQKSWISLDYTNPNRTDILKVINFLGLEGLNAEKIQEILDENVNSLKDRFGIEKSYPNWKNWNGGLRRCFDQIAESTMQKLGYYKDHSTRWKPENYGSTWINQGANNEWYGKIYEARKQIHEHFIQWVNEREPIESITDFGCGLGVGYSEAFKDKRFIGIDINPQCIEWCKKNRKNPNHEYLNQDFIASPLKKKTDIVFSSGTIDNTYDIDECLKSMVKSAKKHIYLTAYRGWFQELEEHKYQWNPIDGCFYNDISPKQIFKTLNILRCTNITIEPLIIENLLETLITANVENIK